MNSQDYEGYLIKYQAVSNTGKEVDKLINGLFIDNVRFHKTDVDALTDPVGEFAHIFSIFTKPDFTRFRILCNDESNGGPQNLAWEIRNRNGQKYSLTNSSPIYARHNNVENGIYTFPDIAGETVTFPISVIQFDIGNLEP